MFFVLFDLDDVHIIHTDDFLMLKQILLFCFCRFTIRMATPINSTDTTRSNSLINGGPREHQCAWADRELLYLQRGPLLADA
jgi:hypothetical protein